MKNIIDLINALSGYAWPIIILILLIKFRKSILSILKAIQTRIERGDPFGISKVMEFYPRDPKGTLPTSRPQDDGALQNHDRKALPLEDQQQPQKSSLSLFETLNTDKNNRILLSLGVFDPREPSGLTGTGDAMALSVIQESLSSIPETYYDVGVIRKNMGNLQDLLKKYPLIFAIGGPATNQLTQMIMKLNPVTFDFSGTGGIVDVIDQTAYNVNLRETKDRLNFTEYGLIVSAENPSVSSGRIVVLAGCTGFGTHAAALAFIQIMKKDSLRQQVPPNGLFEVVLESNVVSGAVNEPKIIKLRELQIGKR